MTGQRIVTYVMYKTLIKAHWRIQQLGSPSLSPKDAELTAAALCRIERALRAFEQRHGLPPVPLETLVASEPGPPT